MVKKIYCDLDTPENNYDYKCSKLNNDDWDECADPCENCVHRCCKTVDLPE